MALGFSRVRGVVGPGFSFRIFGPFRYILTDDKNSLGLGLRVQGAVMGLLFGGGRVRMEIKGQNVMTEWATTLRRDASTTGTGHRHANDYKP